MFLTPDIKTYLQDAFPDIADDKRIVRLRCYVNPITYELAREAHPSIAATLFHKLGSEMVPRSNIHHCKFALDTGPYSLTYSRNPNHMQSRVLVPYVTFSKIEAGKITPESSDFALMFTLSFEKNDPDILNDLSDLLHEHFYLTFGELQPGLFDSLPEPVMELRCRLCDAPNPEFATTDNRFAYCVIHEANTQEGEQLKRIRDTAAAAAVTSEMTDEPPVRIDGRFINERASRRFRPDK